MVPYVSSFLVPTERDRQPECCKSTICGLAGTSIMTLPNRTGYVPGQQRRERKCVATAGENNFCVIAKTTPSNQEKPPHRILQQATGATKNSGELQQELQMMLTSLSPANGPSRRVMSATTQLPASMEEAKVQVERTRKRLFDDELFQQNESFRRLVTFANNPVLESSLGVVDPFEAAIKLLPTATRGHRGVESVHDGFSGDGSSRSPYTETLSLQSLARAMSAVVEDPTVRSRYGQARHSLQEYAERRVHQQQQQQQQQQQHLNAASRGMGLMSTPLPLSMGSVSPFALELAARNSLPKKRSSLSKMAKTLMREWFEENLHHPYPTEEEKEWLASQGGITLEQVNNWFINTRGRKWKPMLNRLMAEKQAGDCKLYDKMVEKIEEPYHREF